MIRPQPKRTRLPRSTRLAYGLYQMAIHLALPLAGLLVLWRARREPGHLHHLHHRLGLGPVGAPGAVWVYAASLGEMNAARPLVQKYLDTGHDILLTHLSPAGFDRGVQLFGGNPRVTHRYMPLDCFWMVRLFLARAKPALGIVLEIEIWPAMLIEADRAAIPMVLANGNLLPSRMARQATWRKHGLYLYRLFDHIFTRSRDYVDRYVAVGVPAKSVSVTGDLRFDTLPHADLLATGRALRAGWGEGVTFMIASSVKGEEDILMQVLEGVLAQVPQARVIWVPRSPQRFAPLSQALTARGVPHSRRGDKTEPIAAQSRVFLGDSLGEMDLYLGMADLVFVGASFVDHGGHNIIEPLAAGCPVVMGPSTFGIDFAAIPAQAAGVFEKFETGPALLAHLVPLLQDAQALAHKQALAQDFATTGRQAAQACYDHIAGGGADG